MPHKKLQEPNALHEDLRRRIENARRWLVDQGSLVAKRRGDRTYWRLRYYEYGPDGRRHRSIYIGSAENAELARELLAEIRAPEAYYRQTLELAALVRRAVRPLLRHRRRDA